MMNRFKKLALLCVGLLTSISTFAISTAGAWMAGIGGAAAVTLLAVGIHKAKQRRQQNEESDGSVVAKKGCDKGCKEKHQHTKQKSAHQQKKEIKRELQDKRTQRNRHKQDLHKLKQRGQVNSPEAQEHRSMLKDLEMDIKNLQARLRNI